MPIYNFKFQLIKVLDERTAEASKEKQETIMAKNLSFAKLALLKKYYKKDKQEIMIGEIECVIDHSATGGIRH
jgi:hypothetical protein